MYPPHSRGPEPEPSWAQKLKRSLGPIGVVLVVCLKFLAKLKFIILPILKFLPLVLKTGGTMLLSIWLYGMMWGIWFAVGFVLLIFVHECGHLLAAKRIGLKVGAPVFIPFMGALIALKEAPRNAWIEAQVGIGGPLLGAIGSAACIGLYFLFKNPLFLALAYTGFFLNLFNLAPVGFLDGGRIVTALSPWLWVVGFVIILALTIASPNFLLVIILAASLPRLFSLFRKKTDEEKRFYEVLPWQRWTMGALYFGLIAFLMIGMELTHLDRSMQRSRRRAPQQDQYELPERGTAPSSSDAP
jgi:Zn-dependent protease